MLSILYKFQILNGKVKDNFNEIDMCITYFAKVLLLP